MHACCELLGWRLMCGRADSFVSNTRFHFHVVKGKLECLYCHVQKTPCTSMHIHILSGIVRVRLCISFLNRLWFGWKCSFGFNEWGIYSSSCLSRTHTPRVLPFTLFTSRRQNLTWIGRHSCCLAIVTFSRTFFSWQRLKLNAQSSNLSRSIRLSAQYSNENITLKPVTFEPYRQ